MSQEEIIRPDKEATDSAAVKVKVLIAEDVSVSREVIAKALEGEGYEVIRAVDGRDCLDQLSNDIAVAIIDLRMPVLDGFTCLKAIQKFLPLTQVIVLSAMGVPEAVDAIKMGASSYLQKPVGVGKVLEKTKESVAKFKNLNSNSIFTSEIDTRGNVNIIANAKSSKAFVKQLDNFSSKGNPILLHANFTADSYSAAKYLGQHSNRFQKAFFTIDCEAHSSDELNRILFGVTGGRQGELIPGVIELAQSGILFLQNFHCIDSGNLALLNSVLVSQLYAKIATTELNALNLRLVASSRLDIDELGALDDTFKACLNNIGFTQLDVPTLSERKEDLADLINQYVKHFSNLRGARMLTEEALNKLLKHSCSNGIDALENTLYKACSEAQAGIIEEENIELSEDTSLNNGLAPSMAADALVGLSLSEIENLVIRSTIKACNGNKAAAARLLKISDKSVYNKCK